MKSLDNRSILPPDPPMGSSVRSRARFFKFVHTVGRVVSQNQLTNASALSLPGETLKTDLRN